MHAESSRRWLRILTILIPVLALTGCGEGDGQVRILGTAATPEPPAPPGQSCDYLNFEDFCPPALESIVEFEGGPISIVGNAQVDAGNDSATVGQMQKFLADSGATFGGSTMNLNTPFDVEAGSAFTMKVWSPRPVRVLFQPEPAGPGTGVEETHGGTGWEVLTFNFPGLAGTVSGITLIFDNGVLGNAGGDPDNWTFYFDDITLVPPGGATAPSPIDPDVALYRTDGDPDLVIPDDYAEITPFGSQSVINPSYADDASYSPVLAVSSGVGYGANVAQVGYIGFDAGFAGAYETLDFKVNGMPNSVLFVKLFDAVDSLRLNLTSSDYSEELGDGWYQVSIPISAFNGVSLGTGIVFESDNTAAMQFTMLLTDIGFSGTTDDGGDTGGGDDGATAGIVSETNNDTVIAVGGFVNSADFGGNSTVGMVVAASSLSNGVTAFDGTDVLEIDYQSTGGEFGGALIDIQGVDISGFTTLKFSINTSQIPGFADLTIQIEPPGGPQPGNNVALSAYTPVATSGDWSTYEIPLADFPGATLTGVNVIGFWNARDGGDALVYGQLYLDDVHLVGPGGGDTGGGDDGATAGIISETNNDTVIAVGGFVNSADFGGNNTVGMVVAASSLSNGVTAFDGTDVLEIDYQSTGGEFGGALIDIQGVDISGFTTLKFSINTSQIPGFADLTIQIEPPGGPQPGNNVALSAYTPVATSGDWSTYEIPLADFPGATLTGVNVIGFWNARDGGDALVYGQLYLDDVHLVGPGGGDTGGGPGGDGNFVNGDFENGLTGWSLFQFPENVGSITADSSMQGGRAGTVGRLMVAGSAASANDAVISQEFLGAGTIAPGDSIDVSFDLYGSTEGAGGVVFVEIIFLNGAGEDVGGRNFLNADPTPYAPTGAWTGYSGTVTAGTGFVPNPSGGPYDVSGGVVLSLKAACGPVDGCAVDASFDNVTFTINGGG